MIVPFPRIDSCFGFHAHYGGYSPDPLTLCPDLPIRSPLRCDSRTKYSRKLSSTNMTTKLTLAIAEVIRDPPDAPITTLTAPSWSVMIVGAQLDCGRFPGDTRLLFEGGNP